MIKNEEYFIFLDELIDSGVTNMYGAIPYLMKAYSELTEGEASIILSEWMQTFSKRHHDAN